MGDGYNKPFYSLKEIFRDNWEDYQKFNDVRDIEREEVEKMLSCKDKGRGCFVCYCEVCDSYRTVPLGCNSRLC